MNELLSCHLLSAVPQAVNNCLLSSVCAACDAAVVRARYAVLTPRRVYAILPVYVIVYTRVASLTDLSDAQL